jgi:NADH dehydrogenase
MNTDFGPGNAQHQGVRQMSVNIVVVGGGFGGLETALSLKNLLHSSARIRLIDKSEYHAYMPSIHEIISGRIRTRDIQISLSLVLGIAGIEFVHDQVLSVDLINRQVVTSASEALDFDYLVLASGAENNFYDVRGAEVFSHRFRSPDDAERIHADLDMLLTRRGKPCAVIIAGGGTEGMEVAGEVLDMITERGFGRDLTSGRISLEIIQAQEGLLPGFPAKVQKFAREYLSGKGIKIITGNRIAEVQQGSVILESGMVRDMSMLIWTGGIQPAKLIRELPLTRDPQGWLKVNARLQSPDDIRVYGVGDIISIYEGEKSLALSRLAYHAVDQALIASLNIARHLQKGRQVGYAPKAKPQLISIGKDTGIFVSQDRFLSGQWVVLLKKALQTKHIMTYLTKPTVSTFVSKVPGVEFRHLLRLRLPF